MDGDGWMWGHDWGCGGWLAMSVMVLFWAALITAVVVAMRYRSRHTSPVLTSERTEAEGVLAGWFARGEIGEDEYRRRVAVLHEHQERI
jgi:putative membrane protein